MEHVASVSYPHRHRRVTNGVFDLRVKLLPDHAIVQGEKEEVQQKKPDGNPVAGGGAGAASTADPPVSHWRTRLTLNIVGDHFLFDKEHLPGDVHRYLRV